MITAGPNRTPCLLLGFENGRAALYHALTGLRLLELFTSLPLFSPSEKAAPSVHASASGAQSGATTRAERQAQEIAGQRICDVFSAQSVIV